DGWLPPAPPTLRHFAPERNRLMPRTSHVLFALVAVTLSVSIVSAQQPAPAKAPSQQQHAQQQMQVQPRPQIQPQAPFHVEAAHQAWLDQVLAKWEADSKTVTNFYCDFERD